MDFKLDMDDIVKVVGGVVIVISVVNSIIGFAVAAL